MNNSKHYWISLIKSGVRIFSSLICLVFILIAFLNRETDSEWYYITISVLLLGTGYLVAEVIGIVEEYEGTDRKEN